jgi:hypothetical protein
MQRQVRGYFLAKWKLLRPCKHRHYSQCLCCFINHAHDVHKTPHTFKCFHKRILLKTFNNPLDNITYVMSSESNVDTNLFITDFNKSHLFKQFLLKCFINKTIHSFLLWKNNLFHSVKIICFIHTYVISDFMCLIYFI